MAIKEKGGTDWHNILALNGIGAWKMDSIGQTISCCTLGSEILSNPPQ